MPRPTPLSVLLVCLVSACAEVPLPRTSVSIGHDASFGTDLAAPNRMLGLTFDDPLHRLP